MSNPRIPTKRIGVALTALALAIPTGIGAVAFADTDPAPDGSTVNAYAPEAGGTQTTSVRESIPLGESSIDTSNLASAISWTPEYNVTVDSSYSDVSLDTQDGKYELLGITPADFGADGLPGTADDASDWEISFAHTEPLNLSNSGTPTVLADWNGENSPLKGTIPGHVETGTSMNITTTLNAEELPGDISEDNTATGTITTDNPGTVTQSKWAKTHQYNPNEDTTLTWGISWDNRTENDHGEVVLTDIFPYEGDNRGTTTDDGRTTNGRAPLLDLTNVDEDVIIEGTTDSPSSVESGNANWMTYDRNSGSFSGILFSNITAVRITDPNLEAGATQNLDVSLQNVYADPNNTLANNLSEATVESLGTNIPATPPVTTSLYAPLISGKVFYDANENGRMDKNEEARFSDVEINLYDSYGDYVDYALTLDDGSYVFNAVELGETYTAEIINTGETIADSWELTTPPREVTLTPNSPMNTNVNFGYHGDNAASVSLDTEILDYDGTEPIPNGETRTVAFTITNTGETPLVNASVSNNEFGAIDCLENIPTLQPGEDFVCEADLDIEATELFEE